MITTAAMNVTLLSAAVVVFAIALRLIAAARPAARGLSARLLALFGTFALAALYVWLALGPELDRRLVQAPLPVIPGGLGEIAAPIDV